MRPQLKLECGTREAPGIPSMPSRVRTGNHAKVVVQPINYGQDLRLACLLFCGVRVEGARNP